jgi:RimJ/RimL family protein N-acetyltransferase
MTGGDVSDLELLEVEIETLWPMDDRGRITTGPDLVIASAASGSTAAVGSAVSNQLAAELKASVRQSRSETVPGSPPPVLEHCRRLLEAELGPVELTPGSGPSYLIPDSVAFPSAIRLVRSNEPDIMALRGANPGNWEAEEWQELLDGQLGPWVMALDDNLVIAICHTARRGARGAEAGVWTRPGFRGQGHAAAVTAAWAALLRPDGRRLFYSTARTNLSSQRVAARLGLRPLGWLWQLARQSDEDQR